MATAQQLQLFADRCEHLYESGFGTAIQIFCNS